MEHTSASFLHIITDQSDRLELIAGFADALADRLPGDSWHLAHAIREVALGHMTIDEAVASVSED
jgi:hypothetical protein